MRIINCFFKQSFADPVNGNLKWSMIEAVLQAIICRTVEGTGSSVAFEKDGILATFHRLHPDKASLRYRVQAVREFLLKF